MHSLTKAKEERGEDGGGEGRERERERERERDSNYYALFITQSLYCAISGVCIIIYVYGMYAACTNCGPISPDSDGKKTTVIAS